MVQGFTFGQCAFDTGTTRIDPESDVHFGLLLLLAAGDAAGVQRDEIASMLWPSSDDESSRHCLRQAMYRLRQLGAPVRLRGGRVSMPADECALDLRQILWEKPPRDELIRLGGLQFLPGYTPRIGAPFAQWVEELRQRVSGRLRRVLADEIADARSNDRYHQVGRLARALLILDPLNETATLGLAESMALEGSKVEAIRMLEAYEEEVGAVSGELRIPARLLRRRVSECLDDSLLPRHFEVPFVGREKELRELRDLFRLTSSGLAQTSMVTGEAGIGKTRLATELQRLAALEGATVATYNTSAGDTFTPLTTLVSVSQILLSLPGALGCAQEHLAYVRRLGTPETVNAWSVSGIAAEVAYAQMVNSIAELVAAIADEAPLILFVDDAHRLHQTTWRILMDLMERVDHRRVLVLLTARQLPEWFGTLRARSCERLTRHVRLAAFERDESLQFLKIWSNKNRVPITADDASECATTSQGNPFYLSELAGHIGRGGDPRAAPASIRELIEMQHAGLSKAGQRVLLVVALLESRATLSRTQQVLEVSINEFVASLEELEAAGLVVAIGACVRCKHDLVSAVSILQSTSGVQSFLRASIATFLEHEADETNSVELLGDAVTQWERARDFKHTHDAAVKLGQRLLGIGMGTEATNAFQKAESNAQSPRERVVSLEGQMIAYFLSARYAAVGRVAQSRIEALRALDPLRTANDEYELLSSEAQLYVVEAVPEVQRLLLLARDSRAATSVRFRAAALVAICGDNVFDVELIGQAMEAVFDLSRDQRSGHEPVVLDTVFHATIGDKNRALILAERLAFLSRSSSDHAPRLQGLRRSATAYFRLGDLASARSIFLESLTLAERLRLPQQQVAALSYLSKIDSACGRIDAAHEFVRRMRALEQSEVDTLYVERRALACEARLAWQCADAAAAPRILEECQLLPDAAIPRAQLEALVMCSGLRLLCSDSQLPSSDLARLLSFHGAAARFGEHDFALDVILAAMCRANMTAEASDLARAYLTDSRRESGGPMAQYAWLSALGCS